MCVGKSLKMLQPVQFVNLTSTTRYINHIRLSEGNYG